MSQSVSDQKPGMSDPLFTTVWVTVIVCTHTINLGPRTHAEIAEQFFRSDLCVVSITYRLSESDILAEVALAQGVRDFDCL